MLTAKQIIGIYRMREFLSTPMWLHYRRWAEEAFNAGDEVECWHNLLRSAALPYPTRYSTDRRQ